MTLGLLGLTHQLAFCFLAGAVGGALADSQIPTTPDAATTPMGEQAPDGLLKVLGLDLAHSTFLNRHRLHFGGWINGGLTVNALSPSNHLNGTVTFNIQNAVPMLNQFYLFLERAAARSGDEWNFGGRADFMYGTDAVFTQTYGSPFGTWDYYLAKGCNSQNEDCSVRFYSAAVPQVYLSINAPVGNGLAIRIGHFYTPFGYEVVTAPDNFFYSHAYTMQYGEPFTHTGLLFQYEFDRNIQFSAGSSTGDASNGCTWRRDASGQLIPNGPCQSGGGWDGDFNSGLGAWSLMAGGEYASDDRATQFSVKGTLGPTSEQNRSAWGLISIILQQDIGDEWHYVLQHDQGFADHVVPNRAEQLKNAAWYGINQYLFWDLRDDLSLGVRAEWFRDQSGFRVCDSSGPTVTVCPNPLTGVPNAAGNSYYAVSLGAKWHPLPWIAVRPNIRWDKSADIPAFGYDPATRGGTSTTQWLFSTDLVVMF